MSNEKQEPEFKDLQIKNWERYQCRDRKHRDIKLYIKDYCGKDIDDPEYNSLTYFQRYLFDACCRIRGRSGRNQLNDPMWVARATGALPKDRLRVPHALLMLLLCGLLILTNQQFDFSESESGSEAETEGVGVVADDISDDPEPDSVANQEPTPVPDAKPTPAASPELKLISYFWKLLGKLEKYRPKAGAWTELATKLPPDYDYIREVMNWALGQSEVWSRAITSVQRCDPFEYFVEKYEAIEAGFRADTKAIEAAHNRPAKIKAGRPADPDPFWKIAKAADGTETKSPARNPKTADERRELIPMLGDPRKNQEFIRKHLVQTNCPTCHGTDLGCGCVTNEEIL